MDNRFCDFKGNPQIILRKKVNEAESGPATIPSTKEEVVVEIKRKIEELAKLVVGGEENVKVKVMQGEKTTVFIISCSRNEIAYLLGRKGRTIDAIRTIVMSISGRHGFRSVVEVPYFPSEKCG